MKLINNKSDIESMKQTNEFQNQRSSSLMIIEDSEREAEVVNLADAYNLSGSNPFLPPIKPAESQNKIIEIIE